MLFVAKQLIFYAKFFTILPWVPVLLFFPRMTKGQKVIALYLGLATVIQIASSYLASQKENNLYLLHLYTPLEFGCIAWFYSIALKDAISPKVFLGVGIGFAILSVLNTIYLQDLDHFNTYARTLEGVLVISTSLLWCGQVLREMKIQRLDQDPVFWINTGFLLYFSGNVLLFAFSNYLLPFKQSLNLYVWAFHGLFNALLYLFITIGLWKKPAS